MAATIANITLDRECLNKQNEKASKDEFLENPDQV